MTMTATAAFEAMLVHHRALTENVSARVAALAKAVARRSAHEAERAELVAYLADEVLPPRSPRSTRSIGQPEPAPR